MARLPRDFDSRMGLRNFAEQGHGYGGDYSTQEGGQGRGYGAYGGMRSDAGSSNWRDFAGEEGWYGQGYAGYPGGEPGGGYGAEYRYGGEYERGFGGGTGSRRGSLGYGGGGTGARREWDSPGGGREMYGGGQRGRQSDAERVRASDIMTEDPEVVTPETTAADAAKKMKELDVGILPVVESQESRRLKGVVTDRDLAIRVLAEGKGGNTKVSDGMTTEVQTVNRNDSVRRVFDVMKREQVRRVPVTDRDGRLVGIIAQADLAVNYAGFDLQRETEVEEVIERISEPGRSRQSGRRSRGGAAGGLGWGR